jgi:hypothetical protein
VRGVFFRGHQSIDIEAKKEDDEDSNSSAAEANHHG